MQNYLHLKPKKGKKHNKQGLLPLLLFATLCFSFAEPFREENSSTARLADGWRIQVQDVILELQRSEQGSSRHIIIQCGMILTFPQTLAQPPAPLKDLGAVQVSKHTHKMSSARLSNNFRDANQPCQHPPSPFNSDIWSHFQSTRFRAAG